MGVEEEVEGAGAGAMVHVCALEVQPLLATR